MTVSEIKNEIIEVLDKIPEDSSPEIIEQLIKLKEFSFAVRNKALVEVIIKEDYELLKRLAE